MKTPIKKKSNFNKNQFSNESKKCRKNFDNEPRLKFCEVGNKRNKRRRTIRENLDDDAKGNLLKTDQKRKQTIRKNLNDQSKDKTAIPENG